MSRLLITIMIWACSIFTSVVQASASERMVFINPGARGEDFWESVTRSMEAAAGQLGIELEVKWAGRNKINMQTLGIAEANSKEKPRVLILVNEERAAMPILEAAEAAGVNTVFLSNAPTQEELLEFERTHGPLKHLLGSIVPDMEHAGYRMAEALVTEARSKELYSSDGKIHLLAIGGDEISATSIARNKGLLNYATSQDDVVVERFLLANWNENESYQLTKRFLQLLERKGSNLAGVWAGNDPMAIGAIKALREVNIRPGVDSVVVGLNWSAEAIELIEKREMLLTDGGHFLTGAWLMVALADHFKGCELLERSTNGPVKLATTSLDAKTDPALLKLLFERNYSAIFYKRFLTHDKRCQPYDFSIQRLVEALEKPE